MQDLEVDIQADRKRFYFVDKPFQQRGYNPEHERQGCNPLAFDGSEIMLPEAKTATFEKDPTASPKIPTNCQHFLFGLADHIGHVPLKEISTHLAPSFVPDHLLQAAEELETKTRLCGIEKSGYNASMCTVSSGDARTQVATFYADNPDEMPKHDFLVVPDDIAALKTPSGESLLTHLAGLPPVHAKPVCGKVSDVVHAEQLRGACSNLLP